jgi:hypothetical protein
MDRVPLRSSIFTSCSGTGDAGGKLMAMNAGDWGGRRASVRLRGSVSWWRPLCWCSLSQRCSTLAFIACCVANVATEAPGCWHAATSWALNSGVYVRRAIPAVGLEVFESLGMVCTIYCVHTILRDAGRQFKMGLAGRLRCYRPSESSLRPSRVEYHQPENCLDWAVVVTANWLP